MIFPLLKAIFGVFILLLLWVGVQELIRRYSPPTPEGCDEIERVHGCPHCALADTCTAKPGVEEDEQA